MIRSFLFAWSFLLTVATLWGQEGHHINVRIDGFGQDSLFLGYYYGDKQYLADTAAVNADGSFTFSDAEALPGGMYLIVMPPDNNFFQVLLDEGDQHLDIRTNAADPVGNMQIKGSKDNQLFYGYLHFLNEKRPEAEKLNKEIQAAAGDQTRMKSLQQQQEALNQQVLDYQQKIVDEHPRTLTAAIIRANQNIDMPDFGGTEQEQQEKRWRYTQKHYFDNIDLEDPRMLRTPFLFERINYFVNKLQVQHPDTISLAIDRVLEGVRPADESFRYYLIHFLNEYARSKIVGMDAVYVHLAEKYYATGQADWTDEEQLKKIVDNAKTLKPLLIGKIAPDIQGQLRDGTAVSLHGTEADYTVLYFWRYDCGHCKKSTPFMKEFYEKFQDKNVKIFAVCVKFTDEVPGCWEYVDENGLGDWIQVVDPYNRSKFFSIYDLKSTPQIYLLDRNKEILSKRIGAEQLEEVLTRLMEIKEQEKG